MFYLCICVFSFIFLKNIYITIYVYHLSICICLCVLEHIHVSTFTFMFILIVLFILIHTSMCIYTHICTYICIKYILCAKHASHDFLLVFPLLPFLLLLALRKSGANGGVSGGVGRGGELCRRWTRGERGRESGEKAVSFQSGFFCPCSLRPCHDRQRQRAGSCMELRELLSSSAKRISRSTHSEWPAGRCRTRGSTPEQPSIRVSGASAVPLQDLSEVGPLLSQPPVSLRTGGA